MERYGSDGQSGLEELVKLTPQELAQRVIEIQSKLRRWEGTHPSLRGVVLAKSEVCYIDPGSSGKNPSPSKLLYWGINIDDLVAHSSFEETAHLIMYGKLPNQSELDGLSGKLKASRDIPAEVINNVRITTGQGANSMAVLRSAVSLLSAFDHEYDPNDTPLETMFDTGIRISSQIATIVAAYHRIKRGLEPVAPDKDYSHAENFLYMLHGKKPTAEDAALMDKDFILHMEHGVNASSFTARVIAGTAADLYSGIVGGIAALSGPKHGGAAEDIGKLMNDIIPLSELKNYTGEQIQQKVSEYIDALWARGGRVPGAGHAIYRAIDARAKHLKAVVRERGDPYMFLMLQAIEDKIENSRRAEHGIHTNVDFWTGVVYNSILNFPQDLAVPIFAVGRTPGWVRQFWEQTKANQLIRPDTAYTGPMDLNYASARAQAGRPL